jgi:phosphoribosylformylglycinamidine cyclo-ligase
LQREARLSDAEAYGTFNMGAGFALFVASSGVERAQDVARRQGTELLPAGMVEAGPRRVVIQPLEIAYGAGSLQVR